MYHKYLICIFSLCVSTTSFMLHAHAEHDKARFVSNKGKNKGDCSNVLRPCASIAYAVIPITLINHPNLTSL